jgi:SAM-dependent methyltransferase
MGYENYFEYRRVDLKSFRDYVLPVYLKKALGQDLSVRILDFGCGFGQLSRALRDNGYDNVEGLDIAPDAIAHCRSIGLRCYDGSDEVFLREHAETYDYIILSHVVEHFPKEEIIPLLTRIHALLKPGGAAIVMVPNAQSHTGAYWAYEDFTHFTLFTSGSLYYVLRSAGFCTVEFLDPDCLEGASLPKAVAKRILLALYRLNYRFWNRVTSSVIHASSPLIFSYEVRALARR